MTDDLTETIERQRALRAELHSRVVRSITSPGSGSTVRRPEDGATYVVNALTAHPEGWDLLARLAAEFTPEDSVDSDWMTMAPAAILALRVAEADLAGSECFYGCFPGCAHDQTQGSQGCLSALYDALASDSDTPASVLDNVRAAAGGAVAVPPAEVENPYLHATGYPHPVDRQLTRAWTEGFNAGWAAKPPAVAVPEDRPGQITDEMVERAAQALWSDRRRLARSLAWSYGEPLSAADVSVQERWRASASAALRAALGDPTAPSPRAASSGVSEVGAKAGEEAR